MVFADQARAAARRADQGLKIGPLHGVPVTVKDSFDVKGFPTRVGSFFAADVAAQEDATVVERLRRAGAILLGKTNTPEFLASYETDNFVTGRTNNPWNLERTPGGSSGGEAAAIAACCSPGGVGSDGGGSIRVPAHFCGIVGLKPTPGRISAWRTHAPPCTIPLGLLSVAGPMARTVADVRMLFEILAGYDERDPFSAPVPLREPKLHDLRIGVMEQWYDVPVQPAIREAIGKAAAMLADLGFAVDRFKPEGIEKAPNLWSFFFAELPARAMKERIAGRESEAHWTLTENLERALDRPPVSSWQVVEALEARDMMRLKLLDQMRRHQVLLLPVSGVAAFRHRERRFETGQKAIGIFQAMMSATPFNLLGMPALAIPFGQTGEGLTLGIQLVGRPYEEEVLLEIGAQLEAARGKFPLPEVSG